MTDEHTTRRRVPRGGIALAATRTGLASLGTAAATPGRGDERGNGKPFGRVWADGVLWRTNVVETLEEEPDPSDRTYFVNAGTPASLPGGGGAANADTSPFVSESAPGDQGWNGGQWVHYSATLNDGVTLEEPLTSEADVFAAEATGKLTLDKGRPDLETTDDPDDVFGPPAFFICPLDGRA